VAIRWVLATGLREKTADAPKRSPWASLVGQDLKQFLSFWLRPAGEIILLENVS
jgi:hypothetical protein